MKPLVSFAVGLAANNFTVKGSHVPKHVIYDQVIVNESTGEGFNRAGYSPISGSFVAPVEGKLELNFKPVIKIPTTTSSQRFNNLYFRYVPIFNVSASE